MAGLYTVTVTDAAGCTAVETIEVTEPMPIMIDISTMDAGCTGNNSGAVLTTVTSGTPPYSYQWSNGQTTASIFNLAAGTYTLTVTDANQCTALALATINEDAGLTVAVAKSNVSCFAGSDGSASVTVMGGTMPFTYQWSNGQTTAFINNVPAGNYSVTVTDANGCTGVGSVNIAQPTPITATVNATATLCQGSTDGIATVNATGGTMPYTYLWSTGATTQTINNLSAGTYTVIITDANNCTQSATTTIIESANYTIDVASQDVFCNGDATGSVLVSGWGGVPPYTYLWNTGSTSPELMNLSAGTYTVTVTDAAGCVIAEDVVINEPPVLTVSANSVDPGCTGTLGTATANAAGGVAPYSYQWSNGQTTQTIDNLSAGTYTVTVIDANFCSESTTITINQGANISINITSIDVTCYAGNDGVAMATASGGTAPYSYQWSNGQTSGGISGIAAGTYTVTATDSNGCSATATTTINQPTQIIATINATDASCDNNDGSATVNAAGGTPPYTYAWSNGASTTSINNLASGTYTVTITDANACQVVASTTIADAPAIIVSLTQTDPTCFDSNDGTISASVSGGTSPFTYNWSTGDNTASINNLAAGTYALTVTDANGCSKVVNTVLSAPTQIVVILTPTGTCTNQNNGSITVNASGGMAPYTYLWSNGAVTTNLDNVPVGDYTLTITDANGCTATANATVNAFATPNCIATVTQDISSVGANDGAATVNANSGNPTDTYLWSNGQSGKATRRFHSGDGKTVAKRLGVFKVETVRPRQDFPRMGFTAGSSI